jgi:hypothetical protein
MKKMFLILCISVFIIAGCDEAKEYNYDRYIYMGVKSLALYYGDEHQIEASPGSERSEIVWTSEDPDVASVSASGLVKATGAGSTNIVASLGESRTSLPVTVTIPTVDNIVVAGENGQFQVAVQTLSDRIKTARIFWNGNQDSTDITIDNHRGVFTRTVDCSGENGYIFYVVSFDRFGNRSQTSETTATLIRNREIEQARAMDDGALTVQWRSNTLYVCYSMLSYVNHHGEEIIRKVQNTETTTIISDYSSDLSYYTLFTLIPPLADTFRVEKNLPEVVESTPFKGPHILSAASPSEIGAKDFDFGGEGLAFHDSNSNNDPNGSYRADNGDPAGASADVEGGGNIGYTNGGEWLVYTVEVQDAGVYEADVFLSVNSGSGGALSISVDGNKSETTVVPNNSDWSAWRWVFETYPDLKPTQPTFRLSAGKHKIRFTFESGGFNLMGYKFTYIGE